MSAPLSRLEQAARPEIVTTLRNAGVSGAGGAGFPTHAKWEHIDEVPFLLVNHQESEPNYYIDKWLGETHAEEFATLFDALLAEAFELVVVCGKAKDRDGWTQSLESATDGAICEPDDLPLDATEESGVVFAYTDDRYEYGMESVLLRIVAGVAMRDELPMDHGWLVQNTETMYNIYRALEAGEPMTHKHVHVDGNVPEHRFLKVPVGTPASELLAAAGRDPDTLSDDEILADGGPGWCFEIERPPGEFGVSKRTNCLLVLDEDVAVENTLGDDRINVISARDWDGDHETEPSTLDVDRVQVPLITNPGFQGVVEASEPIVESGDEVSAGEMIATPAGDISNAHHSPIDGTVRSVGERYIEIQGESGTTPGVDENMLVYWTWCIECGEYVARPERDHLDDGTQYVCHECR